MKSPKDETPTNSGQIVDLASFRKNKETKAEFARGREPLYVSHLSGKVGSNPKDKRPAQQSADFGDRLQRIRASLEKINRLMADLKKMSAEGPTPVAGAQTGASKESKK